MLTSIFIIDDDPIDCLIAKTVIGHSFGESSILSCFHSPILALEALKELAQENSPAFPHFIFLDINMPLMNGFSFLDQFILLPAHKIKQTKVFMISSSHHREDISKAMHYKMVHTYFSKPITREVLETTLQLRLYVTSK